MEHQQKRRRIFVDRRIQGALLLRAALYWAVSLMTQLLIVFLYLAGHYRMPFVYAGLIGQASAMGTLRPRAM